MGGFVPKSELSASLIQRLAGAQSPAVRIAAIEPERVQTRYHDDGTPAWFAAIKRI